MNNIVVLVRDNEDYDYIYGCIILDSNVFDTHLFQKRLDAMREKLGYEDYNGDGIVNAVLNEYDEYKNIKYVGISPDEFFV